MFWKWVHKHSRIDAWSYNYMVALKGHRKSWISAPIFTTSCEFRREYWRRYSRLILRSHKFRRDSWKCSPILTTKFKTSREYWHIWSHILVVNLFQVPNMRSFSRTHIDCTLHTRLHIAHNCTAASCRLPASGPPYKIRNINQNEHWLIPGTLFCWEQNV